VKANSEGVLQLLFPMEPEELLVVDHVPFPLEQDMQAPIAKAAAFMGDRLHALAKAGIVRPGVLYLMVMRQQPMALSPVDVVPLCVPKT
jgi:hypothetical protein